MSKPASFSVGKVRESRQPRIGHLREHAHVAGADVLARFRRLDHHHVDVAAEQRGDALAAAGLVHDLHAHRQEPLLFDSCLPRRARAGHYRRRDRCARRLRWDESRLNANAEQETITARNCECEFHESPCSIARRRHVFNFEKTGTSRMRSASDSITAEMGRETRIDKLPSDIISDCAAPAPSRRPDEPENQRRAWVIELAHQVAEQSEAREQQQIEEASRAGVHADDGDADDQRVKHVIPACAAPARRAARAAG